MDLSTTVPDTGEPPSPPFFVGTSYPVHEMFHTFQGEGRWAGNAAFFIRMYGCPLRCSWCDSAGTWHPDHKPANIIRHTTDMLLDAVSKSGAPICVITGGEPAIHDLTALAFGLRRLGVQAHLETSGAYDLKGEASNELDWVVVSPKTSRLPTHGMLHRADELKLIVEDWDSVNLWEKCLENILGCSLDEWSQAACEEFTEMMTSRHVFVPEPRRIVLNPEWSQRKNPRVLQEITARVKGRPALYKAGWQLHKLYAADKDDPRAMPDVPLGGISSPPAS